MIHIPEKFLRYVWREQRFTTTNLHTPDGRPVRVISPGKSNTDGGPDFVDAQILIGDITYRGDIEIHTSAAGWHEHRHDSDGHYNRVILHVVMTADPLTPPAHTSSDRPIPVLVLHPFLDPALHAEWATTMSDSFTERPNPLKCHDVNGDVPVSLLHTWITKLAHERIEQKVRRFEERLKQLIDESKTIVREPFPRYYGNPDDIPAPKREYTLRDFARAPLWEQLLYEGVMEGMGYSKNREPFLALAQSMKLEFLRHQGCEDVRTVMAALLGAAGLLPSSRTLKERESRIYVRDLRRRWRSIRPLHKGKLLHEDDWLFFRLRPANFPTARIAAMAFLLPSLLGENSFRSLINIFKRDAAQPRARVELVRGLFRFDADEFWSHHYHFRGVRGARGISLGPDRINDFLVNSVIPIVLMYARLFKQPLIRTHAWEMLMVLPPAQENPVTRIVRQQLLRDRMVLESALLHQGAVHLNKFYCQPVRCSECDIGKEVFGSGR